MTAPNGAYVTTTMSATNIVNDTFEEHVGAALNTGRVDGTINSFIIGAAVPVFTTERAGIGSYGGYYAWNTRLDGRLDTAPLAQFTMFNSTWQSPVIGVAGYYQISDSMTLSGVLASMPFVRATWGAFDGRGQGWLANATLSTHLLGQYYIDTSVRWISQTASDTVAGVPIDSNAQSLEAVAAFKVRF